MSNTNLEVSTRTDRQTTGYSGWISDILKRVYVTSFLVPNFFTSEEYIRGTGTCLVIKNEVTVTLFKKYTLHLEYPVEI